MSPQLCLSCPCSVYTYSYLLGVYKHWTGLLEWWNSGMVDWSFVLLFIMYLHSTTNLSCTIVHYRGPYSKANWHRYELNSFLFVAFTPTYLQFHIINKYDKTKLQIINITLRLKSMAYNTVHTYIHLPGAPFAFKYLS